MTTATRSKAAFAAAAAALAAACAASPEGAVGERVLPDTRAIAEHFRNAVAMQGPYAFQLPAEPAPPPMPPPRPVASPTPSLSPAAAAEAPTPAWWARLWPSRSSGAPTPAPPRARPARASAAGFSLLDHLWPPLTPPKPAPCAEVAVAVAEASRPRPAAVAAARPAPPRPAAGESSGLSEIRLGLLKHAVSFGESKEQGMDGNVEALFRSPGWLALAFSPRPHLGVTANGSTRATDFLYAGLTWEWRPWDWLFADIGLGFSVHDGMLDNSRVPEKRRGDRRELGCRALLRGSVEIGYRFLERHSVSALWAHHGNASLCGDDNDGIDNAGIRYGLRM